jgi:hypothetical protein
MMDSQGQMLNKKTGLIIFSALLVFEIFFVACASNATSQINASVEPTKFEGIWLYPGSQRDGDPQAIYAFKGNQFIYNRDGMEEKSGSFIITDNELILIVSGKEVRKFKYSLRYSPRSSPGMFLTDISGDKKTYPIGHL